MTVTHSEYGMEKSMVNYQDFGKQVQQLLMFFDETVDDVYAYILHSSHVPENAIDLTLGVYFSLLQRSRFFWWKNILKLTTALDLADKAILSVHSWGEEARGYTYRDELQRCVPPGNREGTLERLRLFLHTFRRLSLREQKYSVLHYFLRWSPEKIAASTGRSVKGVGMEIASLERKISAHLMKEEAFVNASAEAFLASIHRTDLDHQRKVSLRMSLLERYQRSQLSSLRFVMPLASFLIIANTLVGCILFMSMIAIPSLSAKSTLELIAATEVLLLDEELEYGRKLVAIEDDLRGMASYFAENELASISIDLMPYALRQQIAQETQIKTLFGQFHKQKSLVSSSSELSPEKAFAHD